MDGLSCPVLTFSDYRMVWDSSLPSVQPTAGSHIDIQLCSARVAASPVTP